MRNFLLFAAFLALGIQGASADIFVPAPMTPPLLMLSSTIDKACESYYPQDFEPQGAPGTTSLQVYVLVTGAIGRIGVQSSSGSPTLDAAAVDCVQNLGLIYQPAKVGDRLIAQWQVLDINWSAIQKALPRKPTPKPFFEDQ